MAQQPDKHGPAATAHGGHGADAHGHGDGGHEHDHDTTKYWMVFVALCALTACSFITMHFFGNTPTIGWTIMMAVSCAKAMLVITFFMHLLWEASWKYVLTIPAATMSLFLIFMLVPDVGCRTFWYTEERWLQVADPHAVVETGHEPGPDSTVHEGAAPKDHGPKQGGKPSH